MFDKLKSAFGFKSAEDLKAASCIPSPQVPTFAALDGYDDANALSGLFSSSGTNTDNRLVEMVESSSILSNAVLTLRSAASSVSLIAPTSKARGEKATQDYLLRSLYSPWLGGDIKALLSNITWGLISRGEVNIEVTPNEQQATFRILGPEWIVQRTSTGVAVSLKDNEEKQLPFISWPLIPQRGKPFAIRITIAEIGNIAHAPLRAAFSSSAVVALLYKQAISVLTNRPTVSGVLTGDIDLTEDQLKALRSELTKYKTGDSKAGGVMVLSGKGIDFKSFSGMLEKVMNTDTRKDAASDIAVALGIPLELIHGQSTFANLHTARSVLYEKTVLPLYVDPIISAFSAAFLSPEGAIVVDRDQIEAFRLARLESMAIMAKVDFLTPSEKREFFGYSAQNGAKAQ